MSTIPQSITHRQDSFAPSLQGTAFSSHFDSQGPCHMQLLKSKATLEVSLLFLPYQRTPHLNGSSKTSPVQQTKRALTHERQCQGNLLLIRSPSAASRCCSQVIQPQDPPRQRELLLKKHTTAGSLKCFVSLDPVDLSKATAFTKGD